jgi:hypothetical protein
MQPLDYNNGNGVFSMWSVPRCYNQDSLEHNSECNCNILITKCLIMSVEWTIPSAVQQDWRSRTPDDGHLGPKHVVLIAKVNVNGEINICTTDGKLYVNKVEHSTATECLNTRL